MATHVATPNANSKLDAPRKLRTPFVPLDSPQFITAKSATYLNDNDIILGLEWKGAARAYPTRMITFHHIVNDILGGKPFLVTY